MQVVPSNISLYPPFSVKMKSCIFRSNIFRVIKCAILRHTLLFCQYIVAARWSSRTKQQYILDTTIFMTTKVLCRLRLFSEQNLSNWYLLYNIMQNVMTSLPAEACDIKYAQNNLWLPICWFENYLLSHEGRDIMQTICHISALEYDWLASFLFL